MQANRTMMRLQSVDQIDFETAQSEASGPIDMAATIRRLRASRAEFIRKAQADAKSTAILWLSEDATYEQIKRLMQLKTAGGPDDILPDSSGKSPFRTIDASIQRLSAMPLWARDDKWYESFVGGVAAEWEKIADEIERDD